MRCQRCGTQNIQEAVRCSSCGVRINPVPINRDLHFENKINQSNVHENNEEEIITTTVETKLISPKNSVLNTLNKINEIKFKISIVILCVLPFLSLFFVVLSKFYLQPRYEAEKLSYAEKIHTLPEIKLQNTQINPERVQRDWELMEISLLVLNMQMAMIQASQYFHQHKSLATAQIDIQKKFTQIYFDQYGSIIGKPSDDPKQMLIYHPVIT